MELKIEQHIPLPAERKDMSAFRNALLKMQPGDSFDAPAELRKNVRALVGQIKRMNPGHAYCTRSFDDGNIRVWKVS